MNIKSTNYIQLATSGQFHQYFKSCFFCMKVFWVLIIYIQFGFVIFWRKEIGTKAACKMLVRLKTGFLWTTL